MKKYIIILFSIISVNLAAQQQLVMPFAGKSFTTDQFGNYYEISDVEIKKYSIPTGLLSFILIPPVPYLNS